MSPVDPRAEIVRDGLNNIDSSGEDQSMMREALMLSIFKEQGATGLKRQGGYVDEEFLPQLRGRKAMAIYREMSDNDPIVGALMFAIKRLLYNVEWRPEPAGKTRDDANAAKLVETCLEDMSTPWSVFISEALSMLVYGYSWHEIVYKRRGGLWATDPRHRSKFSDGLVGWRKIPIRSQDTMQRWVFDESGDVRAMIQMAPPRYKLIALPIERSLLFRFDEAKGNPEGRSLLRNAYRPWFMKKRLEEIEAVGVERDLAGLPIMSLPVEMMRAQAGSDAHRAVQEYKKMVKGVRRNEQEGLVLPVAYDQDTNQPLYKFELLGGGGARQFNTDGIIQRYEQRILMTVLADFIMVGHESSGSYSLHVDKTGIFRTALNSIAQSIADVINRHAIPRLFSANGWKPASLPKIVPSDVDSPDISVLAQFMTAMASNGVTWFPDPTLENFVRDAARLPKLDEEETERRRRLQMVTEATAFAAANTEYLQTQQMAQQASMSPLEQAVQAGAAEGLGAAAHADASGEAEMAEQQQAQAEEQAAMSAEQAAGQAELDQYKATDELEGNAHQRELAEREMALKERQAQQGAVAQQRSARSGEKLSLREMALKERAQRHTEQQAGQELAVRRQESKKTAPKKGKTQ